VQPFAAELRETLRRTASARRADWG